ncbi:AAA family ATPase [Enterobacter kobei]|uniref:AAA family ATPase n=1 Tax=Enterobacter kobei TaxID=208224 RepID=UPI002005E6A6|nr:AAA family ATPase [Enterobacter kobei]MCK7021133.1 AAA family ATPase [Enterobacter kobei]
MEISFENLGFIKKGKVKTNDITIIFGPNNVGKTYLSYSIFSILKEYKSSFLDAGFVHPKMASTLVASGFYEDDMSAFIKIPDQIALCNKISAGLPRFFKDTHNVLNGAKVFVDDNNDYKKFIPVVFRVTMPLTKGLRLTISKKRNSSNIRYDIEEIGINDEDLSKVEKKPTNKDTLNRMSFLLRYVLSNKFFEFINIEPFIITSERTGISLFLKEIDTNRNNVVNTIALESYVSMEGSGETIKDIIEDRVSIFAEPINHNINVLRNSFNPASKIRILKDDLPEYNDLLKSLSELVGGGYKVLNDDILFSVKLADDRYVEMPISMSSGAGKSLYLMDVFIKNYISKKTYLIIDEPELNLHPKNQVKMAELLVRLSNFGVKVIITTHSDYIVKEINNRIMASSIASKEMLEELNYTSTDLISKDRVNAFTISKEGFITEVDKDDFGINASLFDEAILDVDKRAETLIGELMRVTEND